MASRSLVLTWLVLMALTVAAGFSARVTSDAVVGTSGLLALMVVTVTKARLILSRYLRLDRAPAFLATFTAAVGLVVVLVTASFFVKLPPAPKPGRHAWSPAAQDPCTNLRRCAAIQGSAPRPMSGTALKFSL